MEIRKSYKVLAWILSICLVITLTPELGFAAEKASAGAKTPVIDPEEVTEQNVVESKKTTDTTTYDLGGGQEMTVFHGGDVRYKDEKGKLIDYDPSLVEIKDGEKTEQNQALDKYAYENKEGDKKQYIPETLSEKTPILMEYKDYQIAFAPTNKTLKQSGTKEENVEVKKEKIPTTYEQEKKLPINAVYGDENKAATLTYTSGEYGVKETLTLEKKPESNVFQYRLRLKGMTARKNVTDQGITFYDKETGDITGDISAPWMNDASGDAYSEAITYEMKKDAAKDDEYLLTMTIDDAYLSDPQRQYPVTVDPSTTWTGSGKVKDAYIISGSYKNTNFYESGTKVMPAGKNSTGTHRTCIQFTDIKKTIKGHTVTSAKLTVYETGTGASKQKVGAHRIKESWSPGSVTWTKRPAFVGTAYSTITTKKTAKSAHTFNLLSYARDLANDSIPSYGIILNNNTATPSYACFYGSRHATSAYRPKLVVTHYKVPNAPSVSLSTSGSNTGTGLSFSHSGMDMTDVSSVQYKIQKYNGSSYADYTSGTANSSGSTALPTLPDGIFRVAVWGVNAGGAAGSAGYSGSVTVDRTPPALTLSGPSTTAAAPSGIKSPTITWSASDTNLSTVQYSVDGGAYSSGSLNASGSQALKTFEASGSHTFVMKATDRYGNVTTKSFTYYLDMDKPSIGNVGIKTKDKETLGTDWTTDANPTIHFDGITDNMPLEQSSIQYAITAADAQPKEEDYHAVNFETISSGAPYEGTFRLSQEEQAMKSNAYLIHLRVKDIAGNVEVKSLAFNRDNEKPTAKLKVMAHSGAEAVTEAKDTVTIAAELNGTGSPLKEAKLNLYRVTKTADEQGNETEKEEFVETLQQDITESTTVEWDTHQQENGTYRLKAAVKDSSDLEGNGTYDIKIVNPQEAPIITADLVRNNPLKVSWEFEKDTVKLKEMQYQFSDDTEWTKVPDSAKASGQFEIQLPKEGSYKIRFRGIDTVGAATKVTEKTCVWDQTAPTAEIKSFARGRIKGTASDAQLKEWKILCKEAQQPDSEYTEKLSGTQEVKDGELGILDLTDTYFKTGQQYQLKLVVTDLAGNQAEALKEIYKPADETCIQVKDAKFNIKRPSWYTDYSVSPFTIAAQTGKMELKELEEGILSSGDITWFVDNRNAGTGKVLEKDFAAYEDGKDHRILAVHKTEKGGYSYSRQVTKNDLIKTVSFGQTAAASGEKTIEAKKDVVSLRLACEAESESGQPLSYQIKVGDGSFRNIEPGKTYRISELTDEQAYGDTFTVKVSCAEETIFADASLEMDTLQAEAFNVSALSNYIPETASVKHRLNDRVYLYWDNTLPDADSSVSYNIYHSADKDFVPSEKNLAAENVQAGYYSEINVNYGGNYYYRITAVKRDAEGKVISESMPSKEFGGRILDYNEHTKRLGLQDYWQYEDFKTPVGSGSIEKSSGNFVYQQTDAALPNEKLEVELTRTYNSQSSEKSAFGLGWTHNYDLELLNVYDKESDSFDNVVFKDSSGSIFRFVKSPEDPDTYISSMGEYITMKKEVKTEDVQIQEKKAGASGENQMKTVQVASQYTVRTKDNQEYRFNGGGQLVYLTEPNGNFLLFEYQDKIGLLAKIITNRNLTMDFTYNSTDPDADTLLVKKVTLPDGGTREYTYQQSGTDSLLTQVKAVGSDGKEINYEYGYDNADTPNVNVIKDAKGNPYELKYQDEKVTEAVYPNSDKLTLTYENTEDKGGKTVTKKLADKRLLLGYREVSSQTDRFDRSGYCMENIDANGNSTTFDYTDGICISSSWKEDSTYVAEDGSIKSEGEVTREELTELGKRRNVDKEVSEDGSVSTYVYYADTSDLDIQDLVSHTERLDADLDLVEDDYYEYDEYGNEIEDYDDIEDMTTLSDYDEDGELLSETEYYVGDMDYDVDMDENVLKEVVRTTSYAYAYDDKGNKTETVTEISGDKKTETITKYDVMGNEVSVSVKSGAADKTLGAADLDSETVTEYDSMGQAVKVTVKDGAITTVTENTYDDNGTLTKETTVTTENGKTDTVTTAYTYDSMNELVSKTTDDNGEAQTVTTSRGYEDIAVHSSSGSGTKTVENAYMTKETDQDGNLLSQSWQDKVGNTVREFKNGLYTDTLYDKYGKEIGTYEAGKNPASEDGLLTLNVYNKKGYQSDTITAPESKADGFYVGADSIRQSTEYSDAGKELTSTDALGHKTSYGYDKKGELNQVTLPNKAATSFKNQETYVNGQLETTVTMTDAKKQVSQVRSNGDGEQLEIKDLYTKEDGTDQSIWTKYKYDEKGRLEKESQAKGNYRLYYYDANDRVTETGYYEKEDGKEKQTLKTTYAYDVSGNVTEMCDYTVAGNKETLLRCTVYTYDKQKRLIAFSECDGPEMPSQEALDQHKVSYTYSKDGLVTDIDYAFAKDGITGLKYHYDSNKWLTGISAKGGLLDKTLRKYTYDDFGRVSQMKDHYGFADGGNGTITRAYSYDRFGRVTSMTYTDSKDADQAKETYAYKYDKNSNIIEEKIVSNYVMADGKGIDCTKNYTYDSVGRLTDVNVIDHREGAAASKMTQYEYDEVGNRTKEITGAEATTYAYNPLNQLTATKTGKVNADTGEITDLTPYGDYSYDRNGNQIGQTDHKTGETATLTYDAANRLSKYEAKKDNAVVVTQENRYNGNGQRIQKKETKGAESKTRNYYYQDGSVLYTSDQNGNLTSLNLMGTSGNVIATERKGEGSPTWYLYNKDVRESTSSMINSAGELAAAYEYDEFGETTVRAGEQFDNEICYTGQVYDQGTGLYYYNARFYDPEDGRFLSQDTYRGEQDEPDTWHLYAYCANNPVNFVDPSGHFVWALPALGSITGSSMASFIAAGIGTTVVSIVSGLSLKKILRVVEKVKVAETVTGALIKSLKTAVKKSWKRKRNTKNEKHHIIAKAAKKAKLGRSVLKKADIGINSKRNLKKIKYNLHKHMHTNSYYTSTNLIMYASTKVGAAMRKAFPKYVSKNKARSINKVSAKATLKAIKLLIGAANLVSKR
ncbi:DNRLRE domain-containing protein [Anaerovorax odorimutans]|uniref:DNRLRE domain-containing protein n=1 Tax=Anaerovorax odorimutans TaxID=109327 RepID=A0ABT1RK16_9FIRM|nr:DNRLRE domain-containing protein [Anaerovorax odorimutans]MCQ4635525.1 DNRLRE domain-containing protein [Anaerovorax odorimutans]